MADVLALVAAFLFALAAALQQREAMDVGPGGMSPGFFLTLARKPVWLAGTAALLAGYAVQAVALADGRLVVIQPLLVTTIVFALPLGIVLSHQVVRPGDWAAAAGVVAALAAFIVVGAPADGRDDAPAGEWLAAFGIVTALSVLAVLSARHARPQRRAGLLGAAAGMLFGLSASLAKPVVEELGAGGVAEAAADWRTWALLGAGGVAFLLQQGALAVGRLAPAVAATSLANPMVATVIGAVILQETLAGGPLRRAAAIGLLVLAGVFATLLAARGGEAADG
ncbi:MAG: DMT family transporter [Thermoleophilia bacterium]|jgi:hypothetical protein|nr:DMT family transporter [Thermoleophilia bacterium]